jgi:hypothetical protein
MKHRATAPTHTHTHRHTHTHTHTHTHLPSRRSPQPPGRPSPACVLVSRVRCRSRSEEASVSVPLKDQLRAGRAGEEGQQRPGFRGFRAQGPRAVLNTGSIIIAYMQGGRAVGAHTRTWRYTCSTHAVQWSSCLGRWSCIARGPGSRHQSPTDNHQPPTATHPHARHGEGLKCRLAVGPRRHTLHAPGQPGRQLGAALGHTHGLGQRLARGAQGAGGGRCRSWPH